MITPLALFGLLILPIIVAFYMLRLRRRDVPVSSTFLWQQLVRDVEANAPWQRLRLSWLLLLQLLIALLVVVAAARPFANTESTLAGNVVLIVDTSASMAAVDPEGDRIELAREAARRVIGELPEGGRVTVVAADDTARVLVSETDDRAAATAAVDAIEVTQLPGDLTDAFALASALAARDADSSVVVVSDANVARLPPIGIGAPVHVERVGSSDANQAIAALSVARRAGGAQLDVFIAVANPSTTEATRRLELYMDGTEQLVDARELTIPPGERSEAIVSSVPASASLVVARLAGEDALALDDTAVALVPSHERVRTLLVGEGNTYLENALALLPGLELYAVSPEGYTDALEAAQEENAPYGLLVFDRFVPDEIPRTATLWIGPAADGPFGEVGGTITGPVLARPDPGEPLLRYIDLATLHVGRSRSVELAGGMRPVVETAGGQPLLAVGRVDGRQLALISFALGESDLPLQVAFPLLMSNLVDYLLPSSQGALPPSMQLGQPIAVSLDPRITQVRLIDNTMGDAQDAREAASITLPVVGGRVTLPAASFTGIRELWAAGVEDGAPDARELSGKLGETAINLFDLDESAIAPGDPLRLIDMGRVVPPDEVSTQQVRVEWWWPLVFVTVLLLCVEWVLFHRPTRRSASRAWRRVRQR